MKEQTNGLIKAAVFIIVFTLSALIVIVGTVYMVKDIFKSIFYE